MDDLADACLFLMRHYDEDEHINVGTGEDLSIRELAETIRDIVAPGVRLAFDPRSRTASPRKLLDVSRLHALGWRHRIELGDGIARHLSMVPGALGEAGLRAAVPRARPDMKLWTRNALRALRLHPPTSPPLPPPPDELEASPPLECTEREISAGTPSG